MGVFRLREAELAHGRVAMLASLGFLVQEKFHPLFSGDGGPAIDQIPKLPIWLWGVMLAGIGSAEQTRIAKGWQKLDPQSNKASSALREGYYPGDIWLRSVQHQAEGPGRAPVDAGKRALARQAGHDLRRASGRKRLLRARLGVHTGAMPPSR